MKKILAFFSVFIFCLSGPAAAAIYVVDPAHSEVAFSVKHLVISHVKGRFHKFEGEFEFDKGKVELKSAWLTIRAESIDTDVDKRDNHLRSSDFFDVVKYPIITFTLKRAKKTIANRMVAFGDITIHGITKGILLKGEFLGAATGPQGKRRVGFTARGVINRKDFGLKWNQVLETGGVLVGDEIKLIIEVEGIEKQ